jgi:hypothetical protein
MKKRKKRTLFLRVTTGIARFSGVEGLVIQTYLNWVEFYRPWVELTKWQPPTGFIEEDSQVTLTLIRDFLTGRIIWINDVLLFEKKLY